MSSGRPAVVQGRLLTIEVAGLVLVPEAPLPELDGVLVELPVDGVDDPVSEPAAPSTVSAAPLSRLDAVDPTVEATLEAVDPTGAGASPATAATVPLAWLTPLATLWTVPATVLARLLGDVFGGVGLLG